MEREEFKILVKGMRSVYTQATFIPDQDAFNMWFALLGDLQYEVCSAAIQKYMLTNKFPPTVAEIRELATSVVNGDPLTFGESWERVRTAIRRFGYYRPQEAMDSLDPLTRRCVESLGFRELCMSENEVADRANFRMVFETMQKREQFEKQLPPKLLAAIESIQLKGLDDSPKLEGVIADVPKLCES